MRTFTVDEFKYALQQIKLSPARLRILSTQYHEPNHAITAQELAAKLGYKTMAMANMQYGAIAHTIADVLGADAYESSDPPFWYAFLSTGYRDIYNPTFVWTMRPELVQALEQLGLV